MSPMVLVSQSSQFQFGKGRSPTLCPGYLRASRGAGLSSIQGSVHYLFISSSCAQVLLGHLKLVCLSCLCASWVTCHPAFVNTGIREARTTAI